MKVDNLTLPASRCRRTSVDNEATRLNAAATSIPYVRIGVLALVFWISSMTCMRAAAPPSVKLQKYATLPLSFERQSPSEFVARGQDYVIDLRGVQATIMLHSSSAIGLEFVHGCQASGTPGKELPGKVNYIRGSDPRLWRLGLSTYESVTYHNLYPGIDIVYYGNQKQLEFDLVLKPGADIRSIRMRFSGQSKLETDSSGSLMLGDLRLLVPAVIQGQRAIPARYRVIGNGIVALEVGAYDRRQPLIIDPTLVYSTRLGGGNGGNQGNAITVDASGNAYVTGYTYASDFPLVNAALAGFEGNPDSFISKINPTGTALAYTTYIGGSNINYLRGIAVDSTGAAWAVGNTKSSDFPIMNPYQGNLGGVGDAVVVKLGPTGALAFSTYLGGPGDDSANAVAVDGSGNAYVTGSASTGFPSTGGAFQQFNQGSTDAFITKFTSNGSLVYSTLAGGTNYDLANGIAVDSAGNAYITGVTYSTSFPGAPTGGAQAANAGSGDAFVAKLNAVGSGLLYFTFLGGSGTDTAQAIAVDPISGVSVVTGSTTSTNLPVSAGAVQPANAGGYDGFVAKLNAAGSTFLYSTYLGGNRRDILLSVAIDPSGNAYVAGYTDSNTFPTNAAIQPAVQGNSTSLFRTSNTGASWTTFDTNLSGAALGLSPDPSNASTIIASTDNGTYRTTNGGATWTQQTVVGYMTLARSPASPSTIYGATGSPVYQSIDNGVTWSFKGSLPACCAGGIIADPLNAATAYVYNSFNSSLPAVQKTVNNGIGWSPAAIGLPATALVTTMVAGSDGSLYAGLNYGSGVSPGGMYKSTNQGATWAAINSGLHTNFGVPPQGLAVSSSTPSVLYVTDYFTLSESTNGGSTWSTIGPLPGGTSALAISSTSSSTLFYAAYDSPSQMWVSTNSGATWSQATGIGVASPNRIVPDPVNGAGAYALSSVSVLPVVAKIDSAGQNLLYSTYLGDYGAAYGIATNGTGDAFVAGSTYEFPTTPSALQRNRNYNQNNLDGFVARISDATAACSYSVDPPQSLELWFDHLVQYVVTAPSGCSWTAASNQAWATIASGASGSGSGIVWVLVANDGTPGTRSATVTIAGQSVTLSQRPGSCGYNSFSPSSSSVPSGGGTFPVSLIAGAGCDWTITNNDPTAVTVVSGASGTGNGTVTLNVAPNVGPTTRTFVIGSPQGGSETITQAGSVQSTGAVSLNPNSAPAGTTSLSLRVNGTGFSNGSTVLWNGSPLPTTFVSPTQLRATVPGALLNTAGSAAVAVGNSSSLTFTILAPAINSLSPQSVGPGSPNFTLTVGGSNFVPASNVQWNGTNLTTGFASSSQLTAMVSAGLVMASGTASVTVVSANSNSNALTFIIGTPLLTCAVSAASTPTLRLEASTELQGDLLANCTGGTIGQTLTSDVTVSANVNLTSRILNAGTQATEAFLLIDDPAPAQQVLGTNVFQGTLTAPNTITFRSVPIKQPGAGTRLLRIVNLRGNAHQFQQASNLSPVPVNAILSMSGSVAINNAQQMTGFVQATTPFRLGSNVSSVADQRTVQVSFTEEFATAFKLRVAPGGQQNIPGTVYNTESGFVNTAIQPTAGLADSASRLMVQFSGVPAGASVYAPVFPDGNTNNTNAQLVATDSNGAGPASFIPGTNMFGGKYAQVTITNGSGISVWEVTAADPFVLETLRFHIVLTGMTQPGTGPIGFAGSLAPLSTVSTASTTDPVPRVAADSITRFVNLTLTSNSTASTGVGALALPGVRPSEWQRTIRAQSTPQVQVGSTLSFTYGLINNGPGPAPAVTVQSNLPSTLSFLDCSTSTGGACTAATNPDGSVTVTGSYAGSLQPGQSPYFVIHAQPLNGAVGNTLSVSTLVSSGMEDLDPTDNALITSFGVMSTAVMVPVSFPSNPAGLKVQVGTGAAQVNPAVMADQAVPMSFTVPSPQADPLGAPGKQYVFNSWSDGTVLAAHASVTPPIGGGTFTANFDTQYQIAVTASPAAGGTVSVAPSGANNFYTTYAPVMITATPAAGYTLTGFTGDVTSAANPLSIVMPAAPLNIRANFVASIFAASPTAVQFGVTPGGALITSQQTINVQAPPGVAWSASANQNFIMVSPTSGTGNGSFTISIVTSALPVSGTASGMVILTAPNFSSSPTVNVMAAIGPSTKPFGSFDTPLDGTTNIAGAIPVTGWALDSIEVLKVDIWREPVPGEAAGPNGLVYIGDAVFVFGARPDVQAANPGLPLNTRGGWGYQMLTNFLPNAAGSGPTGNGVYKLHAIAHNKAGVAVDLGAKTITVDNTHAAKPFGTIDTPSQGGTASGNAYLNFGWALTQNPNIVPIDGSTITVVIDGQLVGHPTYNNYRSDIATLFPGYMNSGGAVGFYYLDTTKLATGVHTISWNVYDNVGHGDGIGSRYFNVFNSSSASAEPEEPLSSDQLQSSDQLPSSDHSPNSHQIRNRAVTVRERFPGNAPTPIEIEELGRIEIPLGAISGYQLVNGQRTPLPIGSSLKRGVFYWQPGPGFLGDYMLVFERPDGTETKIHVMIRPKTYSPPTVHRRTTQ